jgi:hypothetical protein
VIPGPHRQKGAGPQLGARGPDQTGPFGHWPDEDDHDDDQDGEVLSRSRNNPSDQVDD